MRMIRRLFGLRARGLRRDERGAELIEFSLISILMLMLVFGIMEFGRAIWIYGTVAHVAREGARFAIVRGSDRDFDPALPLVNLGPITLSSTSRMVIAF